MCFSATASFIAGTTLSGLGVQTVREVRHRSELPLSLIPLLFGVQQLVEGVLWLTFQYDAPVTRQIMTYTYSVFSHVLWPMFIPFAVLCLERTSWRRRALLGFQAIGVAVGSYLLYFIVTRPMVAAIDELHVIRHLLYESPHFFKIPVMLLYVGATCVSCFLSSHKYVRLFGMLELMAFVAAYAFYAAALVSIWCFFAAILSLMIYLHFRFRSGNSAPADVGRKLPAPRPPTHSLASTHSAACNHNHPPSNPARRRPRTR